MVLKEMILLSKVIYFRNKYLVDLEASINKFISDKDVINVSFAVMQQGYESEYLAIVAYKE